MTVIVTQEGANLLDYVDAGVYCKWCGMRVGSHKHPRECVEQLSKAMPTKALIELIEIMREKIALK